MVAVATRTPSRRSKSSHQTKITTVLIDPQLQVLRDSAKPRALQRQIEFLNDKGAGKTADKKVLLEAADRVLERDSDRRQASP
jgi:hypothetical protein